MAPGFLSWVGSLAKHSEPTPNVPEIVSHPPEDADRNHDDDDDVPPAFPLPSSIQRAGGSAGTNNGKVDEDSIRMPPPSGLPANKSDPANLETPPKTTKPMPNTNVKKRAREKVALTPGHSALDWAKLKSSGADLRAGVTTLLRITPSQLREHKTKDDAWAAFNGRVYNITPYVSFHPGGEKEIMRVAGRDGTKLFALTHSWVNLDYMLDGCMVGYLVPEPSS